MPTSRANHRLEQHHRVCINPYAATSPAEFFAVFSEYFFCAPEILSIHFADIYQLKDEYLGNLNPVLPNDAKL